MLKLALILVLKLVACSSDHVGYTQRVTIVMDSIAGYSVAGPRLVAFAMMNAEAFELPPAVAAWNGKERLTSNACSLAGVKGDLGKKSVASVPLAHLSLIGCSAYARKGLGVRLMRFQRAMALSFGFAAGLFAIEAAKPLDTDWYSKLDPAFYTTTPKFYPVTDTVSLVPMFSKLQPSDSAGPAIDALLAGLAPAVPIDTKTRETSHTDLWPAEDPRALVLDEAGKILRFLMNYMWQERDHEKAAELLRRLTVRAKLKPEETAKLWSMRFHSQAYHNTVAMASPARVPLKATAEWFAAPRIDVPGAVKSLLAAAKK